MTTVAVRLQTDPLSWRDARPVRRRRRSCRCALLVVAITAAIASGGCTLNWYAQDADRSAYGAIRDAQRKTLGQVEPFDLTYRPFGARRHPGQAIQVGRKVIPVGAGEPVALTLDECLEVAFRTSDELQNEKEQLYSAALAVASARRSWDWPLLAGSVSFDAEETRVRKGDTTESGVGEAGLTLTQRLLSGGVLVLGATLDFATDFLGSDGITMGSLIDLNFTQPLLRGAWRGLAYEDQYRLERDLLFAVFEYERFKQTFGVDIVEEYYTVLQRQDELANEAANIQRLRETLAMTRALAEGGQVSRIQQDQAEQDLLDAQIRYEANQQAYRDALDDFKLTLGVPIGAQLELDYPPALQALAKQGPKPVDLKETEAIRLALMVRPDVLQERAAVRDAERDTVIAADDFLPELDVEVDVSATGVEPKKFYEIRFDRRTQVNSISFQYDIDQTENRDAYRNALIAFDRAKRDLADFEDTVSIQVRQAYRSLQRSRRNYELQRQNVEIAKRRRKLAALQQKEGQASARDVLEAEEALRTAQNGLTRALVTYTTTRLDLLASLGLISVDAKGRLHERTEPQTFERLRRRYRYVAR